MKLPPQATKPSGQRKVVFTLLLVTFTVFIILDALVFGQVVPHIPILVSKSSQVTNSSKPFTDSNNTFSRLSGYIFNNPLLNIFGNAEVRSTDLKSGAQTTKSPKDFSNVNEDDDQTSSLAASSDKAIQGLQNQPPLFSVSKTPETNDSSANHVLTGKEPSYREKLKKLGYEPEEDHEFKSIYVKAPKIYPKLSGDVFKNSSRKTKVISCFNCPPWFSKTSTFNHYNRDFKACPYKECFFDAAGKQKETADALLMFVGKLGNRKVPKRPPGQIWIKCYWESPVHYGYPKNYEPWKSAFNWTFTYRTDSDIFAPNNRLAWRDRDELLSDDEYLKIAKKKTKTAAWWVSNCRTHGKREDYVKEMQKIIDVDIYGKCAKLKCGKQENDKCEAMLTTTYKFYLSFENSLCKDYITEKFFRSFQYRSHVIPVARGGFDYDKYIPPGGWINAAHFKTAKDLALHLKKLGNDVFTYAKMLKEKDKLVSLNRKFDWCDICEKLHTDNKKTIPDIKAWSHYDGVCHNPKDIK